MENLRKVNGFWKSLFFMGNICKMRKALMEYLHQEGISAGMKDGDVMFEYNDLTFTAEFRLIDGYAECTVEYYSEEGYRMLDANQKANITNKINSAEENHAIVLSFDEGYCVKTSFYFTSRRMMLDLFCKHFEELNVLMDDMIENIGKCSRSRRRHSRVIGFVIEPEAESEEQTENAHVAAKL